MNELEGEIPSELASVCTQVRTHAKSISNENTEAAALVVIVRSTATGARVGSKVEECVRQGSRSMIPPPFCTSMQRSIYVILKREPPKSIHM